MSTCSEPRRRHRQRGDILLESLIGLAVVGIVTAGLAWMSGRIMSGQRDARVMHMALHGLGHEMLRRGPALCDAPPVLTLPQGSVAASVAPVDDVPGNCSAMQATVTIDGRAYSVAAPKAVVLDLAPDALELPDGPPFRLGTSQ